LTITLADQQDLILAADRWNLRDAQAIVASGNRRAEVRLIRDFDPASIGLDVDDPWSRPINEYEKSEGEIANAIPGILNALRVRLR
jgi:protein-tyrosine-phosphatase